MLRETILFSLVFLAQMVIVSHYLPKQMLARVRRVLDSYPPASYPKLYPQSIEHYRNGLAMFAWVHRAVLALGVLILVSIVFWVDHASFADDGHISEAWPAGYGLVQFLPWMLLELTSYRQLKLMRQANVSQTRKAELRPRRLLSAVSPLLLTATVGLALGSMLFDFYVHDLDFSMDRDSTQRAIVLILTNLFMAALGAWYLYGKKLDPHQSSADRWRQTTVQLKSLMFVSMAMSLFFFSQAAEDVIDLGPIEASLMSFYFLAIAWLSVGFSLRGLKLEDLDLEVYRADASGGPDLAISR